METSEAERLRTANNEETIKVLKDFAKGQDLYGLYVIGGLEGQDLDLMVVYQYEEEPSNIKFLEQKLANTFFENGFQSPEIEIFSVYAERFVKGEIAINYYSEQSPEFNYLRPASLTIGEMKLINEAQNGPVFIFDDTQTRLVGIKLVDASLGKIFLRPRFKEVHLSNGLSQKMKNFKINFRFTKRGAYEWQIVNYYKFVKEFITNENANYQTDNLLNRIAKYRIRLTFGELMANLSRRLADKFAHHLEKLIHYADNVYTIDQVVSLSLIQFYGLGKRINEFEVLRYSDSYIPARFNRDFLHEVLYCGYLIRGKKDSLDNLYNGSILMSKNVLMHDALDISKLNTEYYQQLQLNYAKMVKEALEKTKGKKSFHINKLDALENWTFIKNK